MRKVLLFFALYGCATAWKPTADFKFVPVKSNDYEIATYQKITKPKSDIHIYIEGDGRAFDAYGRPASDPTPRGTMMRDLAMRDKSANVVYMARPCQFIMSSACSDTDWTDGRFSAKIIDSMATAIKKVAGRRKIVLIGYSGGAMVSGLVIEKYPNVPIKQWVTVAGVLDHAAWTNYFGDAPLTKSLNLRKMPNVPAKHYIGEDDKVVPNELSRRAIGKTGEIIVVPNAGHDDFTDIGF